MESFNSSLKDTQYSFYGTLKHRLNFQFLIKGYLKYLGLCSRTARTFQFLIKGYLVMQAKVSKVQVRQRVPKVVSNRLVNKSKNSPLTNLTIQKNPVTNKKKLVTPPVKSQTERTEKQATIPVMQVKKAMQATMQIIPTDRMTKRLNRKRKR